MRIETPRLLLRPLEEADLTAFSTYVLDAELSRMYGLPTNMDHDTAAKIFHAFLQGGMTSALVLRETGCMIGHLMVVPPELPAEAMTRLDGKQGVTLAYAVAPGHQRQGLAFEALSAAIGLHVPLLEIDDVLDVYATVTEEVSKEQIDTDVDGTTRRSSGGSSGQHSSGHDGSGHDSSGGSSSGR